MSIYSSAEEGEPVRYGQYLLVEPIWMFRSCGELFVGGKVVGSGDGSLEDEFSQKTASHVIILPLIKREWNRFRQIVDLSFWTVYIHKLYEKKWESSFMPAI